MIPLKRKSILFLSITLNIVSSSCTTTPDRFFDYEQLHPVPPSKVKIIQKELQNIFQKRKTSPPISTLKGLLDLKLTKYQELKSKDVFDIEAAIYIDNPNKLRLDMFTPFGNIFRKTLFLENRLIITNPSKMKTECFELNFSKPIEMLGVELLPKQLFSVLTGNIYLDNECISLDNIDIYQLKKPNQYLLRQKCLIGLQNYMIEYHFNMNQKTLNGILKYVEIDGKYSFDSSYQFLKFKEFDGMSVPIEIIAKFKGRNASFHTKYKQVVFNGTLDKNIFMLSEKTKNNCNL